MRVAILGLLVLLAGCRSRSAASGPEAGAPLSAEAGASAAAKTAPVWKSALVARSLGNLELHQLEGEALIVRSELYVYAPTVNGTLERFGTPSDYRAFLEDDSDALTGYEARLVRTVDTVVAGTVDRPFVLVHGATPHAFGWDGHTWKVVPEETAPIPKQGRRDWHTAGSLKLDPLKDGPPVIDWSERWNTKDGRVFWLAFRWESGPQQSAWIGAPGSPAASLALPAPHDAQRERLSCRRMDSADGELYLDCEVDPIGDAVHRWSRRYYRLDGQRWEAVFPDRPDAGVFGDREHAAVDAEGALWFSPRDRIATVRRLDKEGTEQVFELPQPSPELTSPTFDADSIATMTKAATESPGYWMTVRLEPASVPTALRGVTKIVPRGKEIWVLGRDTHGEQLFRFAKDDARPTPRLLRSMADENNEVRNARGIRRWIGHCNSIFVPFPSSASEGRAVDSFWQSHQAAIDAAVTKMERPPAGRADVAVVEGTLGDRHVAGVVFVRAMPEISEATMEAAATRVSEIVTPNAGEPSTPTCSVPVIERLVHPYERRHGEATYQ